MESCTERQEAVEVEFLAGVRAVVAKVEAAEEAEAARGRDRAYEST